jgi:pyruvate dehydrogenase E1 component beta subunit
MGIGASMLGVRPVMELMFWSFYSVAFDQILNNAANVRYMSGGQINCPIVIRGPANGGTNVGATHSHTPENVLANHPGIKVVVPATAYDAKGLLKSAIRDNDPVFFLENTILYGDKGEVPTEEYLIPLGLADVKRTGTDLTIVTYGRCVIHSLAAAAILEQEHAVSVEVVDLRTIRPLDINTVLKSVAKTHRVLIVEEQKPFASVGSQLAYMIQREAFDELDGPIHRLATIDAPAMYSPPVETEQLPNPHRIIKAALAAVA